MLSYWGRRGALTLFSRQFGRAAKNTPNLEVSISVSKQNEEYEAFNEFGSALFAVETFQSNIGALFNSWTIPKFRNRLRERLRTDKTEILIELMPHVWSPLVMPVLKQEGVKYAVIIHDANRHPGDHRSLVNGWMKRTMSMADHIITLSDHVAQQIRESNPDLASRIIPLFHPNLTSQTSTTPNPPALDEPFRILFLGRIMKYKGLPLLIDAVEKLMEQGHKIQLGVFGEGDLGASAKRLKEIGAEVQNKWLNHDEIADVLGRYHAVALSHLEASQSGVLALAHGVNLPVVATPVGGLKEQIEHTTNGLLASEVNAAALSAALRELIENPDLYRSISRNIEKTQEGNSAKRFLEECLRKIGNS